MNMNVEAGQEQAVPAIRSAVLPNYKILGNPA
jgi:hypothetical protein